MAIGSEIRRREDQRFLTGSGNYVDDISSRGCAWAAFVRSPHAHARLGAFEISEAQRLPGVLAVITGGDWDKAGLGKMPCISPVPFADGRPMNEALRPVFASERACHVGDVVAMVVATSRPQALAAADAVDITYEPLPCVAELAAALRPGAPLVHEELGTNLAFEVIHGDRAATEAAFAHAHNLVELKLINNRVTANPMEPRCCLGQYDPGREHFTLYTSHQAPHMLRNWLAVDTLRVPEHRIRVVCPDVGGGFGMKLAMYSEDAAVLWASKLVGQPVRWTATRSEGMVSDTHARDHLTHCKMALDRDGHILAVWVDTVAGLGAYAGLFGPGIPGVAYGRMMPGVYAIPTLYVRTRGAYTNTVPTEAYRGAGRPEAVYVVERLLDTAARELGIDPWDIRRRNVLRPEQYPYTTPTGMIYDSGDLPVLLDKLKSIARYDELRREQTAARRSDLLLGIGVVAFTDYGGGASSRVSKAIGRRLGSYEVGTVRVHPSGRVTILAGTQNHGQGHETSYSQIVADRLGCKFDDVELVSGDTDRTPAGLGTWGSRSLVLAGSALCQAADVIAVKCKQLAAHMLEVIEADLVLEDGLYRVQGTNLTISFEKVAREAYHGSNLPEGFKRGLEETVFYEPDNWVFSAAAHLAVVQVDRETGTVMLRDYFAVDDTGRMINPMIVEGQIHGGVAQGVGQALMEECVYENSTAQLLSGSFMDYSMPRASDLPRIETANYQTLAPGNALGVKGAGESGALGAPPAVVNAVVDALAHIGIRHIDMPLTSAAVWRAINAAPRAQSPDALVQLRGEAPIEAPERATGHVVR